MESAYAHRGKNDCFFGRIALGASISDRRERIQFYQCSDLSSPGGGESCERAQPLQELRPCTVGGGVDSLR